MITKNLLGAAVLLAVLGVSGCAATPDPASRAAYLDTMCPFQEEVAVFLEAQSTGGWAGTVRAAGRVSDAEFATADALDGQLWHPSVASHMPAISASLRATGAMWAVAARGEDPSATFDAEAVEAVGTGIAARETVEATLQIEFPLSCNDR